RPLGIGMLMGGAFLGILSALPAMKAAFGGLLSSKGTGGDHGRDELSLKFLAFSVVASFGVLFAAAHFSTSPDAGGLLSGVDPWIRHAIVAAIGTGWIWFAGIIIAQCTGMTDWSPISGLALLTVLVIMVLTNEVVAAVMVGAALCAAISEAADMMGDLKTGYLVGAQPRRQQFTEILAVAIGPAVAIIVTIWLHKAFVLG
ncbi:MAG: OPT/YSL family transporter, partial [Phycisphaerales bacterium]|nr:OPT/YSL family transporter [Phycisphaerales bacterium]